MTVVSDSSPLIALASVNQLALLRKLFAQVLVPTAVHREFVGQGSERPGASEVAAATWIERHPPPEDHLVRFLRKDLDEGEAEAIALALHRSADLILLDERRARQRAADLDLAVTGVLGILMQAKEQGERTLPVESAAWCSASSSTLRPAAPATSLSREGLGWRFGEHGETAPW